MSYPPLSFLDSIIRKRQLTRLKMPAQDRFGGIGSCFSQQTANAGLPCVFTGAPLQKNLSRLRDRHGSIEVTVRTDDYSDPSQYKGHEALFEKMSLGIFLEAFFIGDTITTSDSKSVPAYARNLFLPEEITKDLGVSPPPFYPASCFQEPCTWIGPAGSITPLHCDFSDNFSYQLYGTKRWVIFPPEDFEKLEMEFRPRQSTDGIYAMTTSKAGLQELLSDQKFSETSPNIFDVAAGEVLYLPTGWAHFVVNLSDSMMTNYWIADRSISPAFVHTSPDIPKD